MILYFFIIKSRNYELKSITEVINNISIKKYASPDEITLQSGMPELEKSIRKMYQNDRDELEYLKKLERVRSEFIANVSHELKTPIFTIQGYIETLLNGAIDDPNVRMNFLHKASNHTESLSALVNDLIDISMIEAGELRMSFRYFYINTFISSVINDFSGAAKEKNIKLKFTPVNEKLQVYGDKNRIRQVIFNLLSNAIKYTDDGEVEISVEERSKEVIISVRDTGIGIPNDDITRIFERFYRVDKARSREVGGSGLGLSISKHIIEAHGAKIGVKSALNEGSVFYFPLKK